MKKGILAVIMCLAFLVAKPVGVSMSYYFPKGGYFASPVAPLAIKDIGVTFGKYVGLSGSLGLYNIGGMRIDGLGYNVPKPVLGSFLSLNTSLNLALIFPYGNFEWKGFAGVTAFRNFNPKIMESNLSSAMALANNYDVVNTYSTINNGWGNGMQYGGKITYFLRKNIGISIGATFVKAQSDIALAGRYEAYDAVNGYTEGTYAYGNSHLLYDGMELSIGVTIKK